MYHYYNISSYAPVGTAIAAMSISAEHPPPVRAHSGQRSSNLSALVDQITALLQDGLTEEAALLATSSRRVLPYTVAALVDQAKQVDLITPPTIHFLADMATLFPAVRPIVKAALSRAEWPVLMDAADDPAQGYLAQSILLLQTTNCLPFTINLESLASDHPVARWVAAVALAEKLSLTAPQSHRLLAYALSDQQLCGAEALWEQRQLYLQALRLRCWDVDGIIEASPGQSDTELEALHGMARPQQFVSVCGVALVQRATTASQQLDSPSNGRRYIRTPAMLAALHSLALALQSQRAVIVSGPPGCGKSSLVLELAQATRNDDVVELYLDAHVDSKALLGSYMCSATPGEFYWRPGPLAEVCLCEFPPVLCHCTTSMSTS
eukprot:jgi/Ulvmu1/4343/UM002_0066.1